MIQPEDLPEPTGPRTNRNRFESRCIRAKVGLAVYEISMASLQGLIETDRPRHKVLDVSPDKGNVLFHLVNTLDQ